MAKKNKIETADTILAKQNAKNEARSFTRLLEQVNSEWQVSYDFMKPKWDEWGLRLKLYNNQKRDKEKVGDPLLFAIHQTVIAALYEDRLSAKFAPREHGDIEVASNLDDTAEFDYGEMDKDMLDYFWDWDTGFFGRGLVHFTEWNRDGKYPIPELLDPMAFLRDPRATSAQGDQKGRNGLRFCGWEYRMTKNEMRDAGVYFNIDDLGKSDGNAYSIVDRNRAIRAQAQGFNDPTKRQGITGENQEYRLLLWYTRYQGKLTRVVLAKDRSVVVRFEQLDRKTVPIIDRALYPMSHDWDGVSIPDIIEDKQRARSVLINLGLKSAKAALHPMYLVDANRVTNKHDLDFGFNKNIMINGGVENAILPIQRQGIQQSAQFILDLLDTAAQKATATPDQQQGIQPGGNKTATEMAIVNRGVGARYSLSAKIFGWSEKRFWKQWYLLYKENFEADIDEKIIRIIGAVNASWRPLTKENLIANEDPDIIIESKALADAKRAEIMQGMTNFLNIVLTMPGANKRGAARRMGELNGLHKDDIVSLLPPDVHELKAEEENKLLSQNKQVPVDVMDNDMTHMLENSKATDTPATRAHLNAHKRAMLYKMLHPEAVPADQQGQMGANANTPDAAVVGATSASQNSNPQAPGGRSIPQPMPSQA